MKQTKRFTRFLAAMLMLSSGAFAAGGENCEKSTVLTPGSVTAETTDFISSAENWYSYTPAADGILLIDNCSSKSDASVGVASGLDCATFSDANSSRSQCANGEKQLSLYVFKDLPVHIVWEKGPIGENTEWNLTQFDPDTVAGYTCTNPIAAQAGKTASPVHFAKNLYYSYTPAKDELVTIGDENFGTDKRLSLYQADCATQLAESKSNTISFYAKAGVTYVFSFQSAEASILPAFTWHLTAAEPYPLNCSADTINNGDHTVTFADASATFHFTTARSGSLHVSNPANVGGNLMMLLYTSDCSAPTIVKTADNNAGSANEHLEVSDLEPGKYYLQLVALGLLDQATFSFAFSPAASSTVAGETCGNPSVMEFVSDTARLVSDFSVYPQLFYNFKSLANGVLTITPNPKDHIKIFVHDNCALDDTLALSSGNSIRLAVTGNRDYSIELRDTLYNTRAAIQWEAVFSAAKAGSSCTVPAVIALGSQELDLSKSNREYFLFAPDVTDTYNFTAFSGAGESAIRIYSINSADNCDTTYLKSFAAWPAGYSFESGNRYLIAISSTISSSKYTWTFSNYQNQGPIVVKSGDDLTVDPLLSAPIEISLDGYFSDPENDQLFYQILDKENVTVAFEITNDNILSISGGEAGTESNIYIQATDKVSALSAEIVFNVKVTGTPDPGKIISAPMPDIYVVAKLPAVVVDASNYFIQTKAAPLTYTCKAPDNVLVVARGSRFLVSYSVAGVATFEVTATDEFGSSSTQTFSVTTSATVGDISLSKMPDMLIDNGVTQSVKLTDYFHQPENLPLTYAVTVSDNSLAASVIGGVLQLSAATESEWTVIIKATDDYKHEAADTFNLVSGSLAGVTTALDVRDTTVYSDEPVVLDVAKFFETDIKLTLKYELVLAGRGVGAVLKDNTLTMTYSETATTNVDVLASDQYGRVAKASFAVSSVERITDYGTITSTAIPDVIVTPSSPIELDLSKYFTQTMGLPMNYLVIPSDNPAITIAGSLLTATYSTDSKVSVTVYAIDAYDNSQIQSFTIDFTAADNGHVTVQPIPSARVTPDNVFVLDLSYYFAQTQDNEVQYDYYTDDSTGISIAGSIVTISYVSDKSQTILFKGSDAFGSSESTSLDLLFTDNHEPKAMDNVRLTFTSATSEVMNLNDYFSDSDNDVLQYRVKSASVNGIVSLQLAVAELTVIPLEPGTVTFEIVGSDGQDSATLTIAVTVDTKSSKPVIAKELVQFTLTQGQALEMSLAEYFSHSAQLPMTLTYECSSADLKITNVSSTVISIEGVKEGQSILKLKATDSDLKFAEQQCTVFVIAPGKVPEWKASDSTVTLTKELSEASIDLASLLVSSEAASFTYTVADKIGVSAAEVTRANDILTIKGQSAGTVQIKVSAANATGQSAEPFTITAVSSVGAELNPVSAARAIDDIILEQGYVSAVVDFTGIFSEANAKPLTYTLEPASNTVADMGIIGTRLSILEKALGTVQMAIVATNSDGQKATVSFKITVNEKFVPISFLTLPTSIDISVGNEKQVNALIVPIGADFSSLTWESSVAGIVSLTTEDGYVSIKGEKAGKTTLTLTADNGVKASMQVTVTEPKIQSLGLMFDNASLYVGAHMQLPLVVSPSSFPLSAISIVAENTGVVSVNEGVITALAVGTSAVTVQSGTLKATFTVTVSEKPVIADTVILKLTGAPIAKIGLDIQPAGASIGDYSLLSSNTAVAYINNGFLHVVAPGTVTLTVVTDGIVISKLDYTVANTAPVVRPIPVQSGARDGSFKALILSEYVTDDFTKSSDIVWTVKNASQCKIAIENGSVFATLTNPNWNGTEIVTFVATDAQGASTERTVTYSTAPVADCEPIVPSVAVYPNPASGSIYVEVNTGAFTVKLYNMSGNLVLPEHSAEQGISTLDISSLPAGMYMMQVISGNQLFTKIVTID